MAMTGPPAFLSSVSEAVEARRVRSRLIDGEAIVSEVDGLASFALLRRHRHDWMVTLVAFDLIELDGKDLRREPLEQRKALLAQLVRKPLPGLVLNAVFGEPVTSCASTPVRRAARASSRNASAHATGPAVQIFQAWHLATAFNRVSAAPLPLQPFVRNSIELFPGIRGASRATQKRTGLEQLERARHDPALQMKIRAK